MQIQEFDTLHGTRMFEMDLSDNVSEWESASQELLSSSEASDSTRLNRFKGSKSTWRKLTERDRLVHTSMTKLRDQDLSVHLYNAHAMKFCHYDMKVAAKLRPWANKDSWRGNAHQEEDTGNAQFVAPKSWSAWPLNPDVVPRSEEQLGLIHEADVWTIASTEAQKPSFELEEILMGITLKIAKERFVKREWDPCHKCSKALRERVLEVCEDVRGATDKTAGDFGQNLGQRILEKHPSSIPGGVTEEQDSAERSSNNTEESVDECHDNSSIAKHDVEPTCQSTCGLAHPTVSADDQRSRLLLQPSIRHTLGRLDAVLLALHHARQACLHCNSEQTNPQTEAESGHESTNEQKRSNRSTMPPSGSANLPVLSGLQQNAIDNPISDELALLERGRTSEKEKRGRKRKIHVSQNGETQEEMLIRIARFQKKPIPLHFPAPSGNKSSPRRASRDGFRKRVTSSQTRDKRSIGLGLRDWSEVLGVAALVGISPEVLKRSTRRCANLFGEGMTLRSLGNGPILGEFEDDTMHYLPSHIPVLGNLSNMSLDSTGNNERHGRVRKRSAGYHRQQTAKKDSCNTDSEDIKATSDACTPSESRRCPYDWCVRSEYTFERKDRLLRHMKSVHNAIEDDMRANLEEDDEEIDGGVHTDGFMKEIRRRKGWRGTDGDQRRRSKKADLLES